MTCAAGARYLKFVRMSPCVFLKDKSRVNNQAIKYIAIHKQSLKRYKKWLADSPEFVFYCRRTNNESERSPFAIPFPRNTGNIPRACKGGFREVSSLCFTTRPQIDFA